MKTLTDLLAYYNVLGTLPGISALGKMVKFYKDERGIDIKKVKVYHICPEHSPEITSGHSQETERIFLFLQQE